MDSQMFAPKCWLDMTERQIGTTSQVFIRHATAKGILDDDCAGLLNETAGYLCKATGMTTPDLVVYLATPISDSLMRIQERARPGKFENIQLKEFKPGKPQNGI